MRPSAELRPTLSFSIGVTGHRNDRLQAAGADTEQLGIALQKLFTTVEHALLDIWHEHGAFFSSARPNFRLISPLAEGADQIAAEAAFARGWLVGACLPFPHEIYVDDFAEGDARESFGKMLASAHTVYELSGDRENEAAAYEAVGRMTLDQADLLVAIWDGDNAHGRGGTAQIVAEAVSQRIPVVHVDPSSRLGPQLLWSGLEDAELEQLVIDSVPRAPAEELLKQVVRTLTAPPLDDHNRDMLKRYFERGDKAFNYGISYPLLLSAGGVRRTRRSDFVPPNAEACAEEVRMIVMPLVERRCKNPEAMDALAVRYGRADAAALYYAQLYRSGFVTNFVLAALAVLLALSGLLFPALKLAFITLELILVLVILVNTRAGTRGRWHEEWMDNRHLAERLRCLSLTALLGDLGLRDREERDAAALPGWVRWYSRATAREVGLFCVLADVDFLAGVRSAAKHLIHQQIAYQTLSATNSHRMERRLELGGEWLFGATLIACASWILIKLIGVSMIISDPVTLTELVTFLTALLPAIGAAFYGIRMQGDFAGLSQRAEVTASRLSSLARALERDALQHERLAGRLRRLADITLSDVDRWRSAFKSRPLSLPG